MTLDPLTRFLVAMLPDRYRDDIAGDLTEEALTVIVPQAGEDAARRWMRMQLVRSLPGTMSLHIRQREDDEMKSFKWVSVAAIVSVGMLQAWDSGVLSAPPMIAAIVIVAIALGVAGVFIAHEGIRFGVAVAVIALLFLARLASPVSLPELGLIGIPVFLVLVLVPRFVAQAKRGQGPPSPGAPA
jgi:hypothetical protein